VWYYNENNDGGDDDDDGVLGPRILIPSAHKSESQFCSMDYAY
jgi:hypothetical protein